jgi:hypothetical protein
MRIEMAPQPIFMREATDIAGPGIVRSGDHRQHGGPVTVIPLAPHPAEDALAILPQDREAAIPICG